MPITRRPASSPPAASPKAASRRAWRPRAAPTSGCAARSSSWPRATARRSSWSTPSSSCSRTRSSASRRRAGSSPCRGAPRRSTSPTRFTPMSAIRRSAPRSTGGWRRCCTSSPTATRSRFRAPTAPRRRPHGNRWWSPARPAPRSAARPVPRCAGNMPAWAARSSTALSSARARASPTTSCAVRCHASPGLRSMTCSPPSAVARCSRATSCAASTPITRTSGRRARPACRSRWSTVPAA